MKKPILLLTLLPLALTGCSLFVSNGDIVETIPSSEASSESESSSLVSEESSANSEEGSSSASSSEASSDSSSSTSDSSSSSSSNSSSSSSESSSESSNEPTGYYKATNVDKTLAEDGRYGIWDEYSSCPTVGTFSALVIPLYFTNSSTAFSATDLNNLELAYNGDNLSDHAFYSFKEFYELSSRGQLTPNVTIAEPYQINMRDSAWANSSSYPIDDFLTDYIENEIEDPSIYDSNGDGLIDCLHIIYQTTQRLEWSSFWWHYTTAYYGSTTTSSVKPSVYFFSEFNDGMMNGVYGSYPDTHTIIHESGHSLGLDDYYDYDDTSNSPAGILDMMDGNIGDHCAYSKMVLGWETPYVVDNTSEDFSITLKPFHESGDFILLKARNDEWNSTPWDEYLTFSYYTPYGINSIDAAGYDYYSGGYQSQGSDYKVSGLQAFHVDSRQCYATEYHYSSYYHNNIIDAGYYFEHEEPEQWEYFTPEYSWGTAASNTPSSSKEFASSSRCSYYSSNRLMKAISADGTNYFTSSRISSNYGRPSILFREGDCLSDSTAPTTMNEGLTLGWDFEVTAMDEEGITLHFSAI